MAGNKKEASQGRVLWYNPNKIDNVPVLNEDLNIFVNLYVETKGKSVIANGKVINSGVGEENKISFLSGTKIKKKNDDKSYLTTDYTNLQSYSLNDDDDYSEMLGIESINIDFNTSMAPMIKMKLIDVRGAAIFAKNGTGKYDFFFQMPYPLFHLELKGYYGYPIEYCLHLIRFNSNFNSQTGNFEIECDFIGYTYALLNDMQMSLLRACENTTIGKKKFQEIKSEYKDPSSILTIDETIKKISSINDVANTIKKDDADVKSINKINSIISDCDKLKENVANLLDDINTARGGSAKIKYDYYMYDVVISNGSIIDRKDSNLIKNFNEAQQKLIDTIIKNLTSDLQPIFAQNLNADGSYAKTYFTYGGNIKNNTNNIKLDYDNSINDNADILPNKIEQYTKDKSYYNFIKDIITNELINATNGYENNTNYFWDFRVAVDKINKFIDELNIEKTKKENSVSEKTKKQLNQKYGFDSSIRNLFRVLTTSVEVFLSSMMDVCVNAEESGKRKTELGKLINNFNYVSNDEQKIYPWPEYRAKKEDGSYYEKYLGIDVNKNNVPELLFTEELIDIMITQAKDDREYLNAINGFGGTNIGKNLWWPISVVDGNIPIGTQGAVLEVKKNPYEVILSNSGELYGGYADSSKLLMILRGFLLLGFANRNKIPDDLIKLHAKLEAWNLKTAIDNVVGGNNKLTLKKSLNSLTYDIIKKFGINKGIFEQNKVGEPLKYTYILEEVVINGVKTDKKAYLPINKGFNKVKFEKNGVVINNDDAIKLKESGYLFVGHDYTYKPSKSNDGAIYVNIIEADKVDGKNHVPTFGNGPDQSLDAVKYSTNFAGKKISYSNFEAAIKGKNNTTLYVNPLDANKSINVYSEINYVVPYDGVSSNLVGDDLGKTKDNNSTLPLFFADIPNGYSYNSIIVKIDDTVYNKNDYYYDNFNNVREADKHFPLKVYTSGINRVKDSFTNPSGTEIKDVDKTFDYVKRYNNQNAKGYRHKLIEALSNPNDDKWKIPFIGYVFNNGYKRTIFGSAFYYSQTTPEAKALLFLHCFPFQGVVKPSDIGDDSTEYNMFDLDKNPKILGLKALFTAHNGLIKVPSIWARFIGAILWRLESKDDPINFTELKLNTPPKKEEFLYVYTNKGENPYCGMHFKTTLNGRESYSNIDAVLLNLPKQVKNEFINYFKTYVNGSFKDIQKNAEIGGGNITFDEFKKIREKYKNEISTNQNNTITKAKAQEIFSDEEKKITFLNLDSGYIVNIGLDIEDGGKNFIMEINLGVPTGYVYIQNINPRIWSNHSINESDSILVESKQFELYCNEFIDTFKALVVNELTRAPEEIKEIKTELFGTADNNDIRLNVYRTLMAIYQKWISGTQSGEFFSQCMVHPDDNKIATYERNSLTTGSKLIESFRFVDRAYFDIGDKLYINPKTFSDLIIKNRGATFFDVSNRILNDNNFLFLPLPSFVNFNEIGELKKIFEPQIMNESKQGPSFVCIYAGQISNHLELNDDVYKDDGIYINVDDNGNLTGLPEDFAKAKDDNPYEMNVPVFAVNFGQQNQNFFKDIKLDQKEFSETSESLEIIQDLSNAGDKTKTTSIGQNLFNVYQKRSYSCEVEMMGNLAIQPLMYFQLNNIPMFKGLYLIIKVSHTVKANSISTTFKGVRVKKTKTPLLENNTVLLNLTNTSSSTGGFVSGGGGGFVSGGVGSPGYSSAEVCSTKSLNEMQYNSGFWMYLTHQQGPTGAKIFYEVLYGIRNTLHSEALVNTIKNVYHPACTENKKIAYTSEFVDMVKDEPQRFARIFIESAWKSFNENKNWLITAINGNEKIRTNDRTKRSVYDELVSNKWRIGVDVTDYDLGTYWYIENKLNTDDETNSRYWTMFQLDKTNPDYIAIFNQLVKIPNSATQGYTNWPEVGKLCELYYPSLGANFRTNVGKYFLNTPQNSSASSSSSSTANESIIIGDSHSGCIESTLQSLPQQPKINTALFSGGTGIDFLIKKLKLQQPQPNVKNVIISVGTNGAYNISNSDNKKKKELKTLLVKVFPNAKYIMVKGSIGWLGVANKKLSDVNKYYDVFKNLGGFTIIPTAIGSANEEQSHSCNLATYKEILKEVKNVIN